MREGRPGEAEAALETRALPQGVIPQEGRGRLLCVLCSLHRLKEVPWVPGTNGPKAQPEPAVQQLRVGVLCIVREEGGKHGLHSLKNLHSVRRSSTLGL